MTPKMQQFGRSLSKSFLTIAQFTLTCLLVFYLSPVNATTIGYLSEQGELFRQALAAAKLTPEDVRLEMKDMDLWGGDKYRVKLLDIFFDNPWKISPYTRAITQDLLTAKSNLGQLAASAYKRIDGGVNPQLNRDLLTKYKQQVQKLGDDALAVALGKLSTQPADSFKTSEYKALPPQLRSAIAQFLFTVPDALHYRQVGLLRSLAKLQLDGDRTYTEVFNYAVKTVEEEAAEEVDASPEKVLLIESLLDNVDFKMLNTGAILTAAAAGEMQSQISQIPVNLLQGNYNYSIDTPQGRIILSGQGDQIYPPDDYLLIVDVEGNDTYSGGAATKNIAHGVSVTLDLTGKDRYSSPPGKIPSFGAGIFGYALLLDLQGDDSYQAEYASQGIGIFGTGILYDAQGEDTYQGISNLQGSGTFGSGLLIDNQGSDRYSLYRYGQGYGFTKGVGLLLDSVGDDKYIGLEDKYPNGGPFGAKRHVHFIQGAGLGRRADYTEGHSWAGGVGMLVDGAGSDRYECEVYGQGTAYWYSLGFLVDKAGDDYHDAGWYSLGSSPHFGVGVYQDDSGSDRYTGIIMQSLGNGRDWSIGWFEDSAGNDWYNGSLMTFGTGDINGIGVFWDKHGDDTYLSLLEPAYGQSRLEGVSGLRELMLTLGLFVDGGGKDNYLLLPETDPQNKLPDTALNTQSLSTNPVAGNDRTWCRSTKPRYVKMAYGCGIDAG
ncbi:hypothetical protein [Nostoc sp. UHCC 0252]|uniref:hypothetical protein n=1 Tax=Nostoc sp. UHCC 0252 TaxID=3110241 RepID=UPI002B1F9012|nr:hypothetical protein [Nostoc sp. UHCC 0252]MEA5603864.1 hypothetical protein [Nostoc sp. UHCC 0252]